MVNNILSHQYIGLAQKLFFQDDFSPGSTFWLPDGVYIYERLKSILREIYKEKNYKEVISPNLGKKELWEKSGTGRNIDYICSAFLAMRWH